MVQNSAYRLAYNTGRDLATRTFMTKLAAGEVEPPPSLPVFQRVKNWFSGAEPEPTPVPPAGPTYNPSAPFYENLMDASQGFRDDMQRKMMGDDAFYEMAGGDYIVDPQTGRAGREYNPRRIGLMDTISQRVRDLYGQSFGFDEPQPASRFPLTEVGYRPVTQGPLVEPLVEPDIRGLRTEPVRPTSSGFGLTTQPFGRFAPAPSVTLDMPGQGPVAPARASQLAEQDQAEEDPQYVDNMLRSNPALGAAMEPELGAGVPTPTVPERLGYSAVQKGDTNYNRIANRLREQAGFSNLTGRQLAQFMGNRNLRVGDQIDLDQLRGAYTGTGDTARPRAGVGQVFRQRRGSPQEYAMVNRGVLPSRGTRPAPRPAPSPAPRPNLLAMLSTVSDATPGGLPGFPGYTRPAPMMGPPAPSSLSFPPRPTENVTYLGEATPADRPGMDNLMADMRGSLRARGGR